MKPNARIVRLVAALAAILAAGPLGATELKLDSPETIVFRRLFGSTLLLAYKDDTVQLFRNGQRYARLGPIDDLVGFDWTDADGNGQRELIVITKTTVYRLDGAPAIPALTPIMPNLTPSGQYDIANAPRELQLFYNVAGTAKTAALWFGSDGLYTWRDGAAVRLTEEKLPAFINLVGAELSMPGMDTISLGTPRLGTVEWGGAGATAVYYINDGWLKIVALDGGESVAIALGGNFSDHPGVVWDSVPAAFTDVNGDGLPDLVLFSIEPDASNFGVAMRIVVREFARIKSDRSGNPFSPAPYRSYTLDQMNLANGVCSLRSLALGQPLALVFKTVNITAAMSELILKRNFALEYRSYAFDRVAGRYIKSKFTIPYNVSIDGATPDTAATRTVTQMLSEVDFISLLGDLYTESLSSGTAEIIAYDGKKREFIIYDPAKGPKGRRIRAPAFMRLTDSPFLQLDATGIDISVIRSGVLYWERISR